jgi:hypothetical protein
MTHKLIRSGVFAAILLSLLPAGEAAIIQDQHNGSLAWSFGQFITGQSFTADASVTQLSTLEFYYLSTSTALPAATPLIELFSGAGYGGAVLGSYQFNLAENEPSGYKAADFSGIVLTPGQSYTFRFTQAGGAEGALAGSSANPYAGGIRYDQFGGGFPADDLRFRINGVGDTSVPEPSTALLIGLPLVVALVHRRTILEFTGKPEGRKNRS